MPELVVIYDGEVIDRFALDQDSVTIGRGDDNDLVLDHSMVSRQHARIKQIEGKFIFIDMNSANGSRVNGVRVSKTELIHQDVIQMGEHQVQFIRGRDED